MWGKRVNYSLNFDVYYCIAVMNKKFILYLLLAGLVIGGATAYFMWNKPHQKVEDMQGLSVTASQLCKDFATDEAKANTTYTGKVLDVSGAVSEVKNNQDGKLVITLQSDDPALSVQCTMRDAGNTATAGQNITVRGICASYDMFGPTLTDCVIDK
jgi:hypothetical protein